MVRIATPSLILLLAGCVDLGAADENATEATGSPDVTFDNIEEAPEIADLVVNEFMASNGGALTPKDKSTPDWIEVYNAGTAEVDFGGYFVSDNPGNRTKMRIEEGTLIPAGGFLLLYASGDPLLGPTHMSFGLSSKGEDVVITDRWGRELDWVQFGPQSTDVSVARSRDGDRESPWRYSLGGTPGASNEL